MKQEADRIAHGPVVRLIWPGEGDSMTGALFHGKESALFFKNGILFYFIPVRAAVAEYVNPASYLMNHIGIHPAESDIFIIFQMAYIFTPGVKKKGFAGIFRISRFSGLVYAGHVELVFNGPGPVQGDPVMVPDFRPGSGDEEKVYIHQGFPADELGEPDVIAYGHGAGKAIQLKMGQVVSHAEIPGLAGQGKAVNLVEGSDQVSPAVKYIGPVVNILSHFHGSGAAYNVHPMGGGYGRKKAAGFLSFFIGQQGQVFLREKPVFQVSGSTGCPAFFPWPFPSYLWHEQN